MGRFECETEGGGGVGAQWALSVPCRSCWSSAPPGAGAGFGPGQPAVASDAAAAGPPLRLGPERASGRPGPLARQRACRRLRWDRGLAPRPRGHGQGAVGRRRGGARRGHDTHPLGLLFVAGLRRPGGRADGKIDRRPRNDAGAGARGGACAPRPPAPLRLRQWRTVLSDAAQVAGLCARAGRFSPVLRVNAHSGSDSWTEDEGAAFLARALGAAVRLGGALPPVSHETHRARVLCCPFATARLLRRLPQLRLTSDFSHWVVKAERLLDTQVSSSGLGRGWVSRARTCRWV